MKILLIGNGGREHAIAQALKRSSREPQLFVFANKLNPGLRSLADQYFLAKSLSDIKQLQEFVTKFYPDFAIIGPDNPIADGIADELELLSVQSVAPKKAPAQLESSKYFTRELLEKHFIPGNPRFRQFKSESGVMEFLQELGEHYVVKADGLAFGKGVKVSGDHLRNHEEALKFVRECFAAGQTSVVLEEKLEGVEFSLMAFADGEHLAFMPVVQDHKRAYEGDEGPNTGGMGSYSDVDHSMPFLSPKDLEDAKNISRAVLKAVKEETGQAFKGILYGGFMACVQGVKLIEYNARFGDPEAMNVLPILETDFVEVCKAINSGTLDKLEVQFAKKATVCLYIVPEGYPDESLIGEKLIIGQMPKDPDIQLFYSGVQYDSMSPMNLDDTFRMEVKTTSSRSLGVVGIGDTIEEARQKAVQGVACIRGRMAYRKDIGSEELIQQRVEMMKRLRT